jgi:hypothetical protein
MSIISPSVFPYLGEVFLVRDGAHHRLPLDLLRDDPDAVPRVFGVRAQTTRFTASSVTIEKRAKTDISHPGQLFPKHWTSLLKLDWWGVHIVILSAM